MTILRKLFDLVNIAVLRNLGYGEAKLLKSFDYLKTLVYKNLLGRLMLLVFGNSVKILGSFDFLRPF